MSELLPVGSMSASVVMVGVRRGCLLGDPSHGLDVGLGLLCRVASTVSGLGEGAGEPFQGAAVVTGPLAAIFPIFSSGARLPRWGAAQKNYLDLLYWVTRCHPWGDTVSGLSRLGLVH